MYKNSLIYNGVEFASYGRIEKINRSVVPDIDLKYKEILGKDGALFYDSNLKPLRISFSIRMIERQNIYKIIDDMADNLYSKELHPLNYNGFSTWYDAVLEGLGDPNLFRSQIALLEPTFFVPNPMARSEHRKIERIEDGKFLLEKGCPVRPIYKAYGVKDYTLSNATKRLFVRINLPDSRDIIIDSENEYVYSSEGTSLMKYVDWQSNFFDVEKYELIRVTAPTDCSYYERYLYDK